MYRTGVVMVKNDDTLHAIDEIVPYDSNTDELAQEIKKDIRNVLWCFHPSGAARKQVQVEERTYLYYRMLVSPKI